MAAETARFDEQPAFAVLRSFSGRSWRLLEADRARHRELTLTGNLPPILAQILAARGVTPETLQDYLHPTLRRLLPDPLTLKDMDRAVARLVAAIGSSECIAVLGDYDVDGSCSAALLHDFLAALGHKPRIYIPDRMKEGYGPSELAFETLKQEGASLVITVDCGATAHTALTAARERGMDVIVLDHHATETPAPALAQVNPNQVGDTSGLGYLCAAGVTFMFTVALNRALREGGWYTAHGIAEPDLRDALDLVGLATFCDVVPLVGVNRAFARAGLARLNDLKRPGLAALAQIAKASPPFTPHHLGFVFGPRINAGGRVGRSTLGAELLTGEGAPEDNALALDLHNRERQAIEKLILEESLAMADAQANAPFLLVSKEGWHPGVVGIVAGRLKDRFARPSIAIGFEGGMGRGSGRSVAGVDIGGMIRRAKERGLIDSGGGHAMAAGLSLRADQLDGFARHLAEEFAGLDGAVAAASELALEGLVSPAGATRQMIADMALAGPFGAGNPEPLIAVTDARVVFAGVVGKDHIRLRLAGADGARLDAIAFRSVASPLGDGLLRARGRSIHAAGRLRADEWNGQARVQLHLEDAAEAAV